MRRVNVKFKHNVKKSKDPLYNYLTNTFKFKNLDEFDGFIDDNNLPHGYCEVFYASDKLPNMFNIVMFNANHGTLLGDCQFEIIDGSTEKTAVTKFNFIGKNFGEKYYYNGDKYLGQMKDFQENGFGKITYATANYVIGYFKNKKFHGVCEFYSNEKKLVTKKVFNDGELLYEGLDERKIQKVLEENNLLNYQTDFIEKNANVNKIFDVKKAIKKIENSIVGQRHALNQITNNLLLSLLCESDENKPLTSILLTGPTGVGKTETAKQISKHIFHSKPFVIDFANFHGDHMIASLIGSPAGYVGYDDEPALLKYIKENAETGGVILFEEIDKADSDCYNIFMRILDEGEIISARNEVYSVKNFIILATTNMSVNYTKHVGFSDKNDVKENLAKASTGMKREQVARFNLVVEYENLNEKDNLNLVKQAIDKTIEKLKTIGGYEIDVEYNEQVLKDILKNSNMSFGVREIQHQTEKLISEKVAEYILAHNDNKLNIKINSLDDIEITSYDLQKDIISRDKDKPTKEIKKELIEDFNSPSF